MENSFMTAMLCFNSSFLLKQFNPISQGKGFKMVLNKKVKNDFSLNLKNASFQKLD